MTSTGVQILWSTFRSNILKHLHVVWVCAVKYWCPPGTIPHTTIRIKMVAWSWVVRFEPPHDFSPTHPSSGRSCSRSRWPRQTSSESWIESPCWKWPWSLVQLYRNSKRSLPSFRWRVRESFSFKCNKFCHTNKLPTQSPFWNFCQTRPTWLSPCIKRGW